MVEESLLLLVVEVAREVLGDRVGARVDDHHLAAVELARWCSERDRREQLVLVLEPSLVEEDYAEK